jgi:hypothetical protein
MFAVVRHPDVTVAGVLPEEALEFKRVQGWYRVSEFAAAPADLDVAAYGPDSPDLDAPEPEPEPVKKTKTAKAAETTSEEQE